MTSHVNLDDPYSITNWIFTVRWYPYLIIDLMLKLITHFTSRVHITDISWYQTNKFMFAGKGPNPKQSHINTMRVGTKYWP